MIKNEEEKEKKMKQYRKKRQRTNKEVERLFTSIVVVLLVDVLVEGTIVKQAMHKIEVCILEYK